jgi:membrane-bound ClpP family serine protease
VGRRSLNKNGRVFLVENFEGKEELADSINHLLLVGFYLINIGFVLLTLKYGDKPATTVGAIEFLSLKVGLVVVALGIMHFFNMYVLVRFRRSAAFRKLAREDTDAPAEDDAGHPLLDQPSMP